MWNHTPILAAALAGSGLFILTVDLRGGTLNEDFEAYAPGTFPSPTWLDVGLFHPEPPNPPDPSVTVVVDTDAMGEQTQVLATFEFVGCQGIYQIVGENSFFSVTADIRIDQWCDAPLFKPSDWAMEIGLARISGETQDMAAVPQTGVYASSLTGGWRLYALGTAGALADSTLDTPITIGTWYHVQMELETASGDIVIRIWDLASGTLLLDESTFVPGWTPEDGAYDAVVAYDGELSPGNTVANLAVIDNLHVQVGACPWDCIGLDASVNVLDFLVLLSQWGTVTPCDFDGGGVSVTDLLALLKHWGPCPT